MSLYAGPAEHAANPPSSWTVRKSGGKWALEDARGVRVSTFPTRHAAEAAKHTGFYADLYAKESRWYAGESVHPWKPYSQVAAEQQRLAEWNASRAAARGQSRHRLLGRVGSRPARRRGMR